MGSLWDEFAMAVGVTFHWRRHFGGRLAWNFETLGISLAWNVHEMYPGCCVQTEI